jgi:hypothetical protein
VPGVSQQTQGVRKRRATYFYDKKGGGDCKCRGQNAAAFAAVSRSSMGMAVLVFVVMGGEMIIGHYYSLLSIIGGLKI